jgi:hypothetical protein
MKPYAVALTLLLMCLHTLAAEPAAEPLSFSAVVPVEGASQAELFNRAQAWFATTFNCGKCVIQTSDKEAGQIIGRGLFEYESATFMSGEAIRGSVSYLVKVFVKEGRYKCEITDFTHQSSALKYPMSFGLITNDERYPDIRYCTKGICGKNWQKMKLDSEMHAKSLMESLSKAMSVPAAGKADW